MQICRIQPLDAGSHNHVSTLPVDYLFFGYSNAKSISHFSVSKNRSVFMRIDSNLEISPSFETLQINTSSISKERRWRN
ncbi:unnamed protein product [Larinioides sclopetarius]|uniref:Uncharacterized protein n=1 Tax=Larinioides sclopetarius TaxID=280406 RepID=A0AAV1Z5A4_9ARAC